LKIIEIAIIQLDLLTETEAIRFRMEQMGMTQNDLAKIISHKSRASEILNRKRELTLSMIKKLNQAFSKALL